MITQRFLSISVFLLFWGLVFPLFTDAQDLRYQKRYHKSWNQAPVFDNDVVAEFADEDVVILEERIHFEHDNRGLSTNYRRYIRMRFLTQKGVRKYSKITLPQSEDPPVDYMSIPFGHESVMHRPMYPSMELQYFRVRKLLPDQTTETLIPDNRISQELLRGLQRTMRLHAYQFQFEEIDVGDVIEIEYQWFVPYLLPQRRIFFHGDIAKQKVRYQFSHPRTHHYILEQLNGITPADSTVEKSRPYHWQHYVWTFENLPACTKEVGSRLHVDLPHVTYYLHDQKYGDWGEADVLKYKPYTWFYYTYDQIQFRNMVSQVINKPNPTNIAFKQWFRKHFERDGMSKLEQLQHFHQHINEEFQFSGVRSLAELENRNRIPYMLKNKVLRQGGARYLYFLSLLYLDMTYYHAYIPDNRIGVFDTSKYSYVPGQNRYFVVESSQEKPLFFKPKQAQAGNEMNALPFYLQEVNSLHIAQMTDSYQNKNNFRFITTPVESATENQRNTNIKGIVNLKERLMTLSGEIDLHGQYETLLNGYFEYGTKDSSINHLYYAIPTQIPTHFFEKTEGVNYQILKNGSVQINYANPLPVNFEKETQTYKIPIRHWLQHVISSRFNARTRNLPYYSDFLGTDAFRYQVQFKEEVVLEEWSESPMVIENEFGIFHFKIEQTSPTTIELNSKLHIQQERVKPVNAMMVQQIFRAILWLNEQEIRLKKASS